MAHPLALPKTFSPDALDTTAELATILARLQPPPSTVPGGSDATPLPAVGATPGGGMIGGSGSGIPISLRDLPTATDGLKHKLHHAREQIKALPDMARSIADQETEMQALEARIRQQRTVLAQLQAEGQRFAAGEQEDQDVKMEM